MSLAWQLNLEYSLICISLENTNSHEEESMITPDTTRPVGGGSKSTMIANALERAILANEYKTGELLPSQKELAEKFDVSSRSLREAFKSLEAKGLIEVSQGKRAIVKSNNLEQFVESLSMTMLSKQEPDKKLLSDLLQVRITLEVSATRELSRDSERAIIVRSLNNFVDKMEKLSSDIDETGNKDTIKELKKIDFDFHSIIIKSNDNIILNSIYENLSPQLFNIMEKIDETKVERKKKLNEYHYLVEALKEGQTDLAVALALVNATNIRNKFDSLNL